MERQVEWHIQELEDDENSVKHRQTDEEYAFYNAVSHGDLAAVRQNCDFRRFADKRGVGVLSLNHVTNMKYHFVVTTAIITRLCIRDGMPSEQAFRLSDYYILKMDNLNTESQVVKLHESMVLDFTGKMRMLRKKVSPTKPVAACLDYIYIHLAERLTVDDIAAQIDLSPSYLSRHFKEEIGISLSDYIREKKIEKAQELLKYTDKSLIEIANDLSFSSQSHFIQTFRKVVSMTPKKYRNLNRVKNE